MSIERMAAELQSSPAAVRKARRKLVRLGYFERPQGWKYRRARVEGDDDRGDFWQRLRRDRHLDLAARCAFLLVDPTAKTGQVEVSYAEIAGHLGTRHPVRAVRKVTELDSYFTRTTGGVGQRNTYKRLWDHYESETTQHDDEYEHQEPGTDRPYAFARRPDHRRERAAAHR
jgi:hypothetical protein